MIVSFATNEAGGGVVGRSMEKVGSWDLDDLDWVLEISAFFSDHKK